MFLLGLIFVAAAVLLYRLSRYLQHQDRYDPNKFPVYIGWRALWHPARAKLAAIVFLILGLVVLTAAVVEYIS